MHVLFTSSSPSRVTTMNSIDSATTTYPPRNFSWFVEGKLAGMGRPYKENIEWLYNQGIRRLVNLEVDQLQDTPYATTIEALGIECVCIGIFDFHPPTVDQITRFIDAVQTAPAVSHVCQ